MDTRLASLDKDTPPSTLEATGSTLVNGSASDDLPATRMERSETVPLSPARQTLQEYLGHLANLSAELTRTQRPVENLSQRLAAATSDLQKSEADLATIDAAHAAAIAKAAKDDTFSVEPPRSEETEAAVSRARRNVNTIRMALDEVAQDHERANASVEKAKARFDAITLAIFVEEHTSRLETWAQDRDKFYASEALLRGLHECIGQRGRELEQKTPGAGLLFLRQLEKLRPPWNLEAGHQENGPREVNAAANRWSGVLRRLRDDPHATF
jgi:chromosome segregation ATPase